MKNGQRLIQRLRRDKAGKFGVWQNDAGDWCIGNNCFRMTAAEDGVHVAFNPDGKNCPINLDKALESITKLASEGKPTKYKMPRPVEEDW